MLLHPPVKKLLFYVLSLVAATAGFSQSVDPPLHVSLKPTTDFDQRFYYCAGERQNVWGYRVGVLVNNKFKVGMGGYYMNKTNGLLAASQPFNNTGSGVFSSHKKLYLGTVYYEPFLLRRNLWELTAVFETGYGRTVNYVSDSGNKAIDVSNTLLIPAGAGLSLNIKPPPVLHFPGLQWIGINLMAGYRTILYQQDSRYDYDGAYWSISGAIFLDRVLDDIHQWKRERLLARRSKAIELHY